jgi:hypothetical protein
MSAFTGTIHDLTWNIECVVTTVCHRSRVHADQLIILAM